MTDSASLPAIAILGAGSMGGAILSGLVAAGATDVRVTNRSADKAAALAELEGVASYATSERPDANRLAVEGARVVLIGVKPAMVPDLLREIADVLEPGTIVTSVAAGVTAETMEALLPASVAVVRAMPNTPALVCRGVTGVAAGTRADEAGMALVREVFETVGDVLEIPESQIDALSTISGSGPAYVFYLIEELTKAAVDKGFTPEQAALLVNGTFAGSTELLSRSDSTPEQLRLQVTSPKGTTERAVAVLQRAGLHALFSEATDAALARARELAAGA